MRKILITGANGFIGSKVYEKFKYFGYNVQGWSRKCCDGLLMVDMENINDIEVALSEFQPDVIVHCAGAADVAKSILNPIDDYESNVTITHNLLFSLHKMQLDRVKFVFLSSAGVYGNPTNLPITEDMTLKPMSPYALHKQMCENILIYCANIWGMDVKIVRLFSVFGPGLKKQIFWDMYKKVVTTNELNMFGTGNESRDYIYISDAVEAIVLVTLEKSEEVIFNIANGEEVTIRQVAEIFASAMNLNESSITFDSIVREGNPINWRANISKIEKLGYTKKVGISSGVMEYVKWARNRRELGEMSIYDSKNN